MAREKQPDPPGDDVPGWIMTFSDVITLLMTFFILLLTFATNQPETFDRVQVAMFGGGGSRGFVSEAEGMVRDAILMRERARSGRIFHEGSEIAPIYSDPGLTSLANGIAGLEETPKEEILSQHQLVADLATLVDEHGQITAGGKQRLKMLALQLTKLPLQLDIAVPSSEQLPAALKIAEQLTEAGRVSQAQVGVAVAPHQVQPGKVKLILARVGASRGS